MVYIVIFAFTFKLERNNLICNFFITKNIIEINSTLYYYKYTLYITFELS